MLKYTESHSYIMRTLFVLKWNMTELCINLCKILEIQYFSSNKKYLLHLKAFVYFVFLWFKAYFYIHIFPKMRREAKKHNQLHLFPFHEEIPHPTMCFLAYLIVNNIVEWFLDHSVQTVVLVPCTCSWSPVNPPQKMQFICWEPCTVWPCDSLFQSLYVLLCRLVNRRKKWEEKESWYHCYGTVEQTKYIPAKM